MNDRGQTARLKQRIQLILIQTHKYSQTHYSSNTPFPCFRLLKLVCKKRDMWTGP